MFINKTSRLHFLENMLTWFCLLCCLNRGVSLWRLVCKNNFTQNNFLYHSLTRLHSAALVVLCLLLRPAKEATTFWGHDIAWHIYSHWHTKYKCQHNNRSCTCFWCELVWQSKVQHNILTSFVFNTASFGLLPFRWNTPQTQMIHPQQNLSHRNYQVIILGWIV